MSPRTLARHLRAAEAIVARMRDRQREIDQLAADRGELDTRADEAREQWMARLDGEPETELRAIQRAAMSGMMRACGR